MNITLRHLHQHNALLSCYWSVLESLGKTEPDDEPLSVAAYHYCCGLRKTAIFLGWVGNAHKAAIWRYAIWCVEQAQARRLISDPLFAEIFDAAKRMAQGEIGRKSIAKQEKKAWKTLNNGEYRMNKHIAQAILYLLPDDILSTTCSPIHLFGVIQELINGGVPEKVLDDGFEWLLDVFEGKVDLKANS